MKYLPAFLLSVPLILQAQTPAPSSLTVDQVASILKQLDQVEQQITKNRGEAFSTALTKFKAAAASEKGALDLYTSCYKLVNFDRKDLKQTDYQDWETRNEGFLKNPDVATGLQHQLEYLVLSLQAQDAEDLAPLIPALQGFVTRMVTNVQSITKHSASGAVEAKDNNNKNRPNAPRQGGNQGPGGQLLGMLRTSIRATEFTKAFQLENYFTRKDWEYEPLNITGIYDKTIIPYYLEEKPSEIPAQWDARIAAELAFRRALLSETEYSVYYKDTYPQMQWAKAQYLWNNKVDTIMALADMLKIIRDNPAHAKAGDWLKELRQNVNAAQPATVSPSVSETPPTAAPTTPAP